MLRKMALVLGILVGGSIAQQAQASLLLSEAFLDGVFPLGFGGEGATPQS